MIRRCITGEPTQRIATSHVIDGDFASKKKQKLGRTGHQRRALRLSLSNRDQDDQYKQKLRSHSRGAQNSRGSESLVMQCEYWALPKMADLRAKQLKDPDIAPLIRWMENGKRPSGKEVTSTSPATHHYWLYWDSLVLTEGVLFHKFAKRDGTGHYVQFVVPRSMKDIVLYQMHEALTSRHLGI